MKKILFCLPLLLLALQSCEIEDEYMYAEFNLQMQQNSD